MWVDSTIARDNEFTTDSAVDHPLVVQFAASEVEPFVAASRLVANDCQVRISDILCIFFAISYILCF